MMQVITNLLSNAARYTPSRGRITISAASSAAGEIVVTVSDNGIGILKEDLGRVFEMFTQVGGPGGGGLGIGLALVRRIIELHGGTVEAHSDGADQGTRVVATLPAAIRCLPPAPLSGNGHVGPPRSADGGHRRVLVVDDNADSAEMMKALLDLQGHDVRVAYDGPSALAREFAPDIALLDIGLPGLSGYEVAERLRQQEPNSAMRLVAVTGWGQEQDRERAREAGFDAHVTKPADPDQITRIVRELTVRSIGI